MSDPVSLTPLAHLPPARPLAPAKSSPAPAAAQPSLVPDPRMTVDPKTNKQVLAYYDPATHRVTYIPGSASADFPPASTSFEV